MDILPTLFCHISHTPRLHKIKTFLTALQISPLPEPNTNSFTPQYPLKGGHEDVTKALKKLFEEDIIEPSRSHIYNSPIWPVKKPNGTYRITIDYRNLNKASPKIDGCLPESQEVINIIQRDNPRFMAAIDLSDMFFAISIAEKSRPITTFTWQDKQYQFKRLPQGYKNSPTIAHNLLANNIDPTKYKSTIIQNIDDILLYNNDKEIIQSDLESLVTHLRSLGWTINPDKIQPPDTKTTFLGIHWSSEGRNIPNKVIDKLLNLKSPTNKKEAQQLMGLFMYWTTHTIPSRHCKTHIQSHQEGSRFHMDPRTRTSI